MLDTRHEALVLVGSDDLHIFQFEMSLKIHQYRSGYNLYIMGIHVESVGYHYCTLSATHDFLLEL